MPIYFPYIKYIIPICTLIGSGNNLIREVFFMNDNILVGLSKTDRDMLGLIQKSLGFDSMSATIRQLIRRSGKELDLERFLAAAVNQDEGVKRTLSMWLDKDKLKANYLFCSSEQNRLVALSIWWQNELVKAGKSATVMSEGLTVNGLATGQEVRIFWSMSPEDLSIELVSQCLRIDLTD